MTEKRDNPTLPEEAVSSSQIPRREYLKGLLSGVALSASVAAPSTDAPAGHHPSDDSANVLASRLTGNALLDAFVRMRGRTDGKPVFGWLSATRSVVVDGDIVPLCGVVAGAVQRFEKIAEDQYEATVLEVAHYTHPVSGELLKELTMPVTGRTVAVPAYRFGPSKVRFAVALDEWEEFDPVKTSSNSAQFAPRSSVHLVRSIGPAIPDGQLVHVRADEYGRVYPDRAQPPTVFYREWMIWRTLASLLANSSASCVAAEYAYTALSGWRPWMQMDGVRGHTAENGFGRKAERWEDCPAQFLELTERLHPDVLAHPERVLRTGPAN